MSKHFNIFLWFLFISILVLLFVGGVSKSKNQSDFNDYYRASISFSNKKDIYHVELIKNLSQSITLQNLFQPENLKKLEALKGNLGSYIYPPTFAFLLMPMAQLDYPLASLFFFLINFLCLLLSLFLIHKMIPSPNIILVYIISLLFSYRFLENHIINNQVAFILIFLILLSVYTKSSWLAAILLSLGIVIKITPGIFILYFLYKRRYLILILTVVFLAFWLLLPSLAGHEYNMLQLKNWYLLVLDNAMKNPIFRAWKNNQSLLATLAKYFLNGADLLNQPRYSMPFVSLSATTVKGMFYALTVTILAPLFWRMKKGIEDNLLLACLFILSVVLSGVSWIHSFSVLLFSFVYAVNFLYERQELKRYRIILGVVGLMFILLGRQFIGSGMEDTAMMYSVYLYVSLALYILLLQFKDEESVV